ncbi:MAG TPA: helix-turn-helix transcriptional regulator [Candidatus Binataceae bacterium]|nr:helix-turn-helix transcriptional regulator [Candidatus Binataceae bacterium]
MKTFGQVITEARKKVGLTQKEVAERLRRGDGRTVLPPYLNDLEHDRRYPPENEVIEQLAEILGLSPDVLYFYAKRVPADVQRDADNTEVEAAYRAFRQVIDQAKKPPSRSKPRR